MSFVCSTEPLFFVGQPLDVLKTLRTLLPDAPSSQAQRLLSMVSLRDLLQHPCVSLCLANASVSMAHTAF